MARAALEVADVFRRCGAAYRAAARRVAVQCAAACHERDRTLPHRRARRPRRAVRRLRPPAHRLQLVPQSALPEVPVARPRAMARGPPGRTARTCPVLPRRLHRCPSEIAAIAFQNKTRGLRHPVPRPPPRPCARSPPTRSTWAPRSASSPSCTPGGRTCMHHPHLHCVVPGGGIAPDGERWIACRPGFFLPVRVLVAAVPAAVPRTSCEQAFDAGAAAVLLRHSSSRCAERAGASRAIWHRLRQAEWVVYAKPPFGGPEQVLDYLGPLHPPRRHLQQPPGRPSTTATSRFRWKDYRHGSRTRRR